MKKKRNILLFAILLLIFVAMPVYAENIKCGNLPEMNKRIPDLVSETVRIVFVAVPVILVITGVIDLVKGIMSAKEDEIKKSQTALIKKIVTGVLIFFMYAIVALVVSMVSGDSKSEQQSMMKCVSCFINGC